MKIFTPFKTCYFPKPRPKVILFFSAIVLIFVAPLYAADYAIQDIALTPGKNISEININWYSNTVSSSLVQVALKSAMKNQDFPESSAVTYYTTQTPAASGFYSHRTVLSALSASTEYVYRIGDGLGNWTPAYEFKTASPEEFTFVAVGDAQIGMGNTTTDTSTWISTLNTAINSFPETSFIMSMGDQVQKNNNEALFNALLSAELFKNVPFVPTLGNKDDGTNNTAWHFFMPNMSSEYGVTRPGMGDYFYRYGKALFIILNSNNSDIDSHESFINESIAQHPDVIWKIVALHHSLYGAGSPQSPALQSGLSPIFDAHNIDIVLAGHQHSYTRSNVIKGDEVQMDLSYDDNGAMIDPNGTIYLTLNSSSGSMYNSVSSMANEYVATSSQLNTPTFSTITLKGATLRFSSYRTDTMEMVDGFSIVKEISEPNGMMGDVNHDEKINIVDALLVAQYYVGLGVENFDSTLADVNCDGQVNIVDALNIARFYVGLLDDFCANNQ